MTNMIVRIVAVVAAIAAMALAGYQASRLDAQVRAAHDSVMSLETLSRQATQALSSLGAAERGYVADGQNPQKWQTQVTALARTAAPLLKDLRQASTTPEAQGVLESAIETMTAFDQSDSKARDYLNAGQRLSASDVVFADGSELLSKAIAAIEDARVHERARYDATTTSLRQKQLYCLGGALALTVVVLLSLVPAGGSNDGTTPSRSAEASAGLGLSLSSGPVARAARAPGPVMPPSGVDESGAITNIRALATTATICGELARVRNSEELPALLERVAGVLNASGVIVWMSEGLPGTLRPVLGHGYPPATLARLGSIASDADNVTAKAYRTRDVQTIPADAASSGAIVAPLVVADGCTGVMAVELKKGVDPGDYLRAVAGIMAAQLATLITPAPAPASGPGTPAKDAPRTG